MKKRLLLLSVLLLAGYALPARQNDSEMIFFQSASEKEWRKQYVNLGFSNVILMPNEGVDLKSNYGASFSVGRTFFLHRPIADCLRFGIDATWVDINYVNYRIEHITYRGTDKYQYHQGEISMNVGPSITVEPARKMSIHGYFRYVPSFTCIYKEDSKSISGNYETIWAGGGSVSYGVIGLGIEYRFGKTKYVGFKNRDESAINTSFSGCRAYLLFRF